jgi:hypothetical protein
MKTTRYTNVVLTLIAASLLWLCGQNMWKPAPVQAQGPVHVIIDRLDTIALPSDGLPVNITTIDGHSLHFSALPVRVEP